MARTGLPELLMKAGLALTAGCTVGLVNWFANFTGVGYPRAFILTLLVLWGALGLLAGLGALAAAAVLRRMGLMRRAPAAAPPGWPRLRVAARRAWAVAVGLALALLAAYVGSAPRFSGLLTTEPRDLEVESAGPPNIILISLDTTRPDHLGAYDYPRPVSASFDALAARGALFTGARVTSSWTIPSHASFFTGMAPSQIATSLGPKQKRGWSKLPDSATTIAEILLASGYHTAGFVGGPTLRSFFGFGQGFEIYEERRPIAFSAKSNLIFGARQLRRLLNIPPTGYLRFMDPPFRALSNYLYLEKHRGASETHLRLHNGDVRWSTDADEVNYRIFRWLDRRPPRPYFLFVNYFDPHDPYEPERADPAIVPESIDPETGFIVQNGMLESVLKDGSRPGKETLEELTALYDAEISFMDRNLGRLLDRLEAEQDLDNAIIAVVSDHGETFGEHGLIFHGHHLYEQDIRQVLLLAGRGVPRGRVVPDTVSGIDVLPTVLDLAGIQVQGSIRGRSLRPLLEGGELEPAPAFSEVFGGRVSFPEWKAFSGGLISVVEGGLKLIRDVDGGEVLFDLERDPEESRDLSGERPEDLSRLGRLLDAYVKAMAVTEESSEGEPPEELLETLRGLGYIE